MSLEERTAAARRFSPELCSLNMGSMNFAIFGMAAGIKEFKYDWEPAYLEMTRDYIFRNTVKDIETIVGTMGAQGTRFRVRVLRRRTALHADALPRPRARDATAVRAAHLRDPRRHRTRRREPHPHEGHGGPPVRRRLSLAGARRRPPPDQPRHDRRHQAGNVRVGPEDSLYLSRGTLATSNAEQVATIIRILGKLSLDVATPDEAREILAPKGPDATSIPAG
jgi:uncharacterized protein (DUF849 family)